MNKGIYIIGTDTGIGKTVITAGIGAILSKSGIDVAVMKPVQSGTLPGILSDSEILIQSVNSKDPQELVNPYRFRLPLAPYPASIEEKTVIKPEKIINSYKKLAQLHQLVLVEGVGGLVVPITKNYTQVDLIKDLELPVLIIARMGLGTINHTCMTIEICRNNGIEVLGVIFNKPGKQADISEKTNPEIIRSITGISILGKVPYITGLKSGPKKWESKIERIISKKVSLAGILNYIKTGKAADYQAIDKKYIWHPFTQMKDWVKEQQIVIESGSGNYLEDINGNKYFDGVSSLWVNVHGHRKKEIDGAIIRQLNKISHTTLLGMGNIPSIQLAEKLVKLVPEGLSKVFYSDNGSTAVEIAAKIAYQYWQQKQDNRFHRKKKFISFINAYHGDTIGSVSLGGMDLFHKVYKPLLFDTYKAGYPYCYRCEYDSAGCNLKCISGFEKLIKNKHNEIAGVVIEPLVQAAAGMLVSPAGFLSKARELCTKYGVLMIVDEVATGFGRTGRMFASSHENVSPDIMCVAKSITGGYLPLAATITSEEVYNGFWADYKEQKTFFHGHTYTGNPLACAAAIANLELFESENIIKQSRKKIQYISNRLSQFEELLHAGDIRQKGFMIGIELVKDKKSKSEYEWHEKTGIRVCLEARKHGIILRPLGNVIVLMPPLSITIDEIDRLLEVTYECIKRVTE